MSVKNKIHVLVVDDSFFMRKLLREILESDPNIEVVGTAKDGDEAIIKSKELNPDVVTMDYNMPGKNGIQAIEEIFTFNTNKKPAIVMISAHTTQGSSIVLDCLRAGAVDFITKPSGELSMDIDTIKDEILLKIHIASMANVVIYPTKKSFSIKEKDESLILTDKVVVIGSSTGGPPLVEDIIGLLPIDLPATVVIVQHMPEYFISRFAERLNKITPLHVYEAKNGDYMTIGKIYVVPADFNFEILENKRIKLTEPSSWTGARPSIDNAMTNIAKIYKEEVVGIILSGMGEDGLFGAKEIKRMGGKMIAQDPKTAVIDSMPNAIISAHLADEILAPMHIPNYIVNLVKQNGHK
jgi:two-component system chemotaxis response regulator CheB